MVHLASGELLRDIGASRFRVLDEDVDARELMRLAGDPLSLHGFLQRDEAEKMANSITARLVPPELFLVHRSAVGQSGEPVYGVPETRPLTSKLPETFCPSAEDCEHAFTIWPEPRSHIANTSRPSSGVIVSVLVASLVLSVLIFW